MESETITETSETNKLAIVIVPDLWVDRSPWLSMMAELDGLEYPTSMVDLPSTCFDGTSTNKSMADDIAEIRSTIAELVDQGKDVTMVCHGTGGFMGCNAIEGLTMESRTKVKLEGGVGRIVFIAAQLCEEDETPKALYLAEPDIVDKDGNPTGAPRREDWIEPVTFCAWKELPSVYAVLTKDKVLSTEVQQQWVKLTESWSVPIESEHMPEFDGVNAIVALVIRYNEDPTISEEEFKENYVRFLEGAMKEKTPEPAEME